MDGSEIHSKTIVIATGVAYKKLEIPGLEKFTGAGVYYGNAAVEAHACRNETIYIVGGGNSACQAAMYMSKFAKEVNIVIRRDALSQTAANYLVENIGCHTQYKSNWQYGCNCLFRRILFWKVLPLKT